MKHDPVFGMLLRDWRRRRHLSQLALAAEAEISQRHLSFIESGRAGPSREMVLRLAERLELPLRERNALMAAAGFAPVYQERGVDSPELAAARAAIERILKLHEPNPALVVDRQWTLVAGNSATMALTAGVTGDLLVEPVNVLRLSLHPEGLAPRILNYGEWRALILRRLEREVEISGDPVLLALLQELRAYPAPPGARPHRAHGAPPHGGVAVPLELTVGPARLSFLSTTTVFGTACEVTLSELTIEAFLPADAETAEAMRGIVAGFSANAAGAGRRPAAVRP